MNPEDLLALQGLYQQNPKLFTQSDLVQLRSIGAEIPEQEEEVNDDFSLLGTIAQIGQGFIQGFTTLNVGDEPRNTTEAIARNIGNVFGFLGIVPGLGTAGKIAASGVTSTIMGTSRLLGAAKKGEQLVGMTDKATDAIKAVAVGNGEMFGRKYRRLNSVPFMVASYGMQGLRKTLPANAVKFLGETKLGTAASEAFVTGLASGVSSWSYGGREMAAAAGQGALEGGAFRAIANFIPGREGSAVALRAFINSAFSGGASAAMGAPLPIVAYHTLLGAAFGVDDLPFAEIQARNFLLRKSEQGTDIVSRRKAFLESMNEDDFRALDAEAQDIVRGEVKASLASQIKAMFGEQELDLSVSEALAAVAMQRAAAGQTQEAQEAMLGAYLARIGAGYEQETKRFIAEQETKDAADKIKKGEEVEGELAPKGQEEQKAAEENATLVVDNAIKEAEDAVKDSKVREEDADSLLGKVDLDQYEIDPKPEKEEQPAAETQEQTKPPSPEDVDLSQYTLPETAGEAEPPTTLGDVDLGQYTLPEGTRTVARDPMDEAISNAGSFLDNLTGRMAKFDEKYRHLFEQQNAIRQAIQDRDIPSSFVGPFTRIASEMGEAYLDGVKGIAKQLADEVKDPNAVTPELLDSYTGRLSALIDEMPEGVNRDRITRWIERNGSEVIKSAVFSTAFSKRKKKTYAVAIEDEFSVTRKFQEAPEKQVFGPDGKRIQERYFPSMLEQSLGAMDIPILYHTSLYTEKQREDGSAYWDTTTDLEHTSFVDGIRYELPTREKLLFLRENGYHPIGVKKDTGHIILGPKDVWKRLQQDGTIEGKQAVYDAIFDDPNTRGKIDSIYREQEEWSGLAYRSPEKKEVFTVQPIKSVDKKAIAKASIATQFIGFGEGIKGSSTELYRQQVIDQTGKKVRGSIKSLANSGKYETTDKIFVSIPGKRGNPALAKREQDKTIAEAIKAIEAGSTLITDNKAYIDSSEYNTGEKRLYDTLEASGYSYWEDLVDGQLLGFWKKNFAPPTSLGDRMDIRLDQLFYLTSAYLPRLDGQAPTIADVKDFVTYALGGRGFVKNANDLVKRMQLFLDGNMQMPASFLAATPTPDGKSTYGELGHIPTAYYKSFKDNGNTVLETAGNYKNEAGRPFEQVNDGPFYLLPEVFDQYRNILGLDEDVTAIKMSTSYNIEDDGFGKNLGAALNKGNALLADPQLADAMRAKGIAMLVPDSVAKVTGRRKINDLTFSEKDGKLFIKEDDIAIYKTPLNAARLNAGASQHKKTASRLRYDKKKQAYVETERMRLPIQLAKAIDDQEVSDYFFDTYLKGEIEGDGGVTKDKALSGDYEGFDAQNLSVKDILETVLAKNHSPESRLLAGEIVHQILFGRPSKRTGTVINDTDSIIPADKDVDLDESIDFLIESESNAHQLRALIDRPDLLTPEVYLGAYKNYFDKVLFSYIENRANRPTFRYGDQAIMMPLGSPGVQLEIKNVLAKKKFAERMYRGKLAKSLKNGTIPRGYVLLEDGLRDVVVNYKGKEMRLGELWHQYTTALNEGKKGPMLGAMEKAMEAVFIRTPMAGVTGARNLKLAGFVNSKKKGYGVLMHGADMEMLGGADLDGDKAFFIFDLDKNGGKEGKLRKYLKDNEDAMLDKDYGESGHSVFKPIKDKAYDNVFLDQSLPNSVKGKAGVLSPLVVMESGVSARTGNKAIGFFAKNTARIIELANRVNYTESGLQYINTKRGRKYLADNFKEETLKLNYDGLQRMADAADQWLGDSTRSIMSYVTNSILHSYEKKNIRVKDINNIAPITNLDESVRERNLFKSITALRNYKAYSPSYRGWEAIARSIDTNDLVSSTRIEGGSKNITDVLGDGIDYGQILNLTKGIKKLSRSPGYAGAVGGRALLSVRSRSVDFGGRGYTYGSAREVSSDLESVRSIYLLTQLGNNAHAELTNKLGNKRSASERLEKVMKSFYSTKNEIAQAMADPERTAASVDKLFDELTNKYQYAAKFDSPSLLRLIRMSMISPIRGETVTKRGGKFVSTGMIIPAREWDIIAPNDFKFYYEAMNQIARQNAGLDSFTLESAISGTASTVQDAPAGSIASQAVGDLSNTSVKTKPITEAEKAGVKVKKAHHDSARTDIVAQKKQAFEALKTVKVLEDALTAEGYFDTTTKAGKRATAILDRLTRVIEKHPQVGDHLFDLFPFATGEFSQFAPAVALEAATYDDLDRFVSFFERSFDKGFVAGLIEDAMGGNAGNFPRLAMYRFPDTVGRMMRADDLLVSNPTVVQKVITRNGVKDLPVSVAFSTGDYMANIFAKANNFEAENVPMEKKYIAKNIIEPLEDAGANPDADVMFRIMVGAREMRAYIRNTYGSGDRLTKSELTPAVLKQMLESSDDRIKITVNGAEKVEIVPEEVRRFRKLLDEYNRIKDKDYAWRDEGGNRIVVKGKEIVGDIYYQEPRRMDYGDMNPKYDPRKAGLGNDAITKFYEDFYENRIGDYTVGIPEKDAKYLVTDKKTGRLNYVESIRNINQHIRKYGVIPDITYNGAARLQYEAELRNYVRVEIEPKRRLSAEERAQAEAMGAVFEGNSIFAPVSTFSALNLLDGGTMYDRYNDSVTRIPLGSSPGKNVADILSFLDIRAGGFRARQSADPRQSVIAGDFPDGLFGFDGKTLRGKNMLGKSSYKSRITEAGKVDADIYWSRMDQDPREVQEFAKKIALPKDPSERRRLGMQLKQWLARGIVNTEMLSPELRKLVYDAEDLKSDNPVYAEQIVRRPPNANKRGQNPLPGWSDDSSVLGKYAQSMIEGQAKMMSIVLGQDAMSRFKRRGAKKLDKTELGGWNNYLKTYMQSYLGVSSLNNEVMSGSDGKVPGVLGMYTSDENIYSMFKDFDRKFLGGRVLERKIQAEVDRGATRAKAEELVQARSGEWMRSLSRTEARFQLVTLLANSRSLVNNIVGGSSVTISSVGLRPWLRAVSGKELARISDEFATSAKRMEFAEKAGAIETYMAREAELSGNFTSTAAKAFLNDAIKAVKRNPSLKDSELVDLARRRGLTDKFVSTAGWFMRSSERIVRTHSFFAHYLKARDVYGATSFTKFDDPFLITLAKKGADATQFLYNSASRPIASATPIGKIFSRFQLYTWNSIKYRREIYKQAKMLGFRPETVEFQRFKTLAAADLFMFGLAAALPFSTFAATIPAPFGALTELSKFFFGDEEERDGAFYGILPYPANIVGLASPPGLRLLTIPVKGSMALFDYMMLNNSDDLEFFLQYDLMSLMPFGSLIRNSYKTYNSPQMAVEFLTGIPLHGLARYHNGNMNRGELYQLPIGDARLAVPEMSDEEKRARRKEIRESAMVDDQVPGAVVEDSDEELVSMVEEQVADFNSALSD